MSNYSSLSLDCKWELLRERSGICSITNWNRAKGWLLGFESSDRFSIWFLKKPKIWDTLKTCPVPQDLRYYNLKSQLLSSEFDNWWYQIRRLYGNSSAPKREAKKKKIIFFSAFGYIRIKLFNSKEVSCWNCNLILSRHEIFKYVKMR